jgi:hypothetical protein
MSEPEDFGKSAHEHVYVYSHEHKHPHAKKGKKAAYEHDEVHPHAFVGIHDHGKGGMKPHSHKERSYHGLLDTEDHHDIVGHPKKKRRKE